MKDSVLRAVPQTGPVQQGLPLPAPPWRPFVSLARSARVGNPITKLVYMVLASYCPTMTKSWTAVGRVRRKTLLEVCEISKLDTLDGHLSALRDAGYVEWRRTGRASDFVVRLSPLHVLAEAPADAPTGGVSAPETAAADTPSRGGSDIPSRGGSVSGPGPADTPFRGGIRYPLSRGIGFRSGLGRYPLSGSEIPSFISPFYAILYAVSLFSPCSSLPPGVD